MMRRKIVALVLSFCLGVVMCGVCQRAASGGVEDTFLVVS